MLKRIVTLQFNPVEDVAIKDSQAQWKDTSIKTDLKKYSELY